VFRGCALSGRASVRCPVSPASSLWISQGPITSLPVSRGCALSGRTLQTRRDLQRAASRGRDRVRAALCQREKLGWVGILLWIASVEELTMAYNIFRKGGIPALAFPSLNDESSPCLCSLVVKVSEDQKEATVMLRFEPDHHVFDTDQPLYLVYDAENWVNARFASPLGRPSQLDTISRRGKTSNLGSLRIALTQSCTVLCSSSGSIALKNGSDAARFQQIMNLATATQLSVTFHYAWLHPEKKAQFKSLGNGEPKKRYPREAGLAALRETDWTVFSPGEGDDPPAYEPAASKRSRQRTSTSPPQTPPAKRREFASPSTTEKATTVATPSPRPLPAKTTAIAAETALLDAVEMAVAKLLPGVVEAALPTIVKQTLAAPASSFSSSIVSKSSPPPVRTSPLDRFDKLITRYLTDYARKVGKEVSTDVANQLSDHATTLRDKADVDLAELIDDKIDDTRLEFTILKDDCLADINRMRDETVQELEGHKEELVNEAKLDAAMAYASMEEKLDAILERLRAVHRPVGKGRTSYRQGIPRVELTKRASSVPLESPAV
jgi:hypothetical protein